MPFFLFFLFFFLRERESRGEKKNPAEKKNYKTKSHLPPPPPSHLLKKNRFAFVTMLTDAGLDCVFSAGEGTVACFCLFFFRLSRSRMGSEGEKLTIFSFLKKKKKIGAMHCLHEKPVEVKRAVPRDQMAAATAAAAQAAAAATVRAAAAAAASASAAPRNCWEPPLSSSGNGFHLPPRSSLPPQARPPHDADYFGGGGGGGLTGPGFAGGSLAAELEALSFHGVGGGGGGEDFYHRPLSPYGGGGNAPFDRSAFEDATERDATTTAAAAADDSGLVAFLARQQRHGNGTASASAALRFEKLHQLHLEEAAPAPGSTHSLSPPEGGGGRYRSLYAPSDVFGPPASTSSASAVAGFSSSEAASSGGEGGGRNSSGEHQRDEERYGGGGGRGFEFFPATSASNVPGAAVAPPRSGGTLSPYSDSLGAAFGYGDCNGKAGEW